MGDKVQSEKSKKKSHDPGQCQNHKLGKVDTMIVEAELGSHHVDRYYVCCLMDFSVPMRRVMNPFAGHLYF